MIRSGHEYQITQERISEFQARLPHLAGTARLGATSILAELRRDAAMWEAGIREPVPGNPDRVSPPWTDEQVNSMSDEEYVGASDQAAVLLKQVEIANIDRQIGIALDRIADWRRHRAWL
ncbi:MAG: hypothetical protein ACRDG4_18005, partial [Chloroflexota bacterium]